MKIEKLRHRRRSRAGLAERYMECGRREQPNKPFCTQIHHLQSAGGGDSDAQSMHQAASSALTLFQQSRNLAETVSAGSSEPALSVVFARSEERRVGKECRSRW